MNFDAVILTGGQSRRMGRDKAFIELDGQTLLARQIQVVRAAGAAEVFISGRPGVNYSAFDCPVLLDKFPDAGPLAGIHSALVAMSSPLLLVLAVDLPAMQPDFLRTLVADCSGQVGVVPRLRANLEPLVALYPKAARPLAGILLEQNSLAVKNFAELCQQAALVSFADLPPSAAGNFLNCNYPGDLLFSRGATLDISQTRQCLGRSPERVFPSQREAGFGA